MGSRDLRQKLEASRRYRVASLNRERHIFFPENERKFTQTKPNISYAEVPNRNYEQQRHHKYHCLSPKRYDRFPSLSPLHSSAGEIKINIYQPPQSSGSFLPGLPASQSEWCDYDPSKTKNSSSAQHYKKSWPISERSSSFKSYDQSSEILENCVTALHYNKKRKRFYCPDGPRTPPRHFLESSPEKKVVKRSNSPQKFRSIISRTSSSNQFYERAPTVKGKVSIEFNFEQAEPDSTAFELDYNFLSLKRQKLSSVSPRSGASPCSDISNYVSSSGIVFQDSPDSINNLNYSDIERKTELRKKRKHKRDIKRLEKKIRKIKLRQEIQRYLNAGIKVEDDEVINLNLQNTNSSFVKRSILKTAPAVNTKSKFVLFKDGLLPGESSDESLNNLVLQKLRKRRVSCRLRDGKSLQLEQKYNLPSFAVPNQMPPPPPSSTPPHRF